MGRGKSRGRVKHGSNVSLVDLRNFLKRDPGGYKREFMERMDHFRSTLDVMKLRPTSTGTAQNTTNSTRSRMNKDFAELVEFLSHTVKVYRREQCSHEFPTHLIDLLDNHGEILDTSLRRNVVQALILLRNKQFISPLAILPTFFRLFRLQDKTLRKMVFSHIVQDIVRVNLKHKDHKLNKSLQGFMYQMLTNESAITVKKSLSIMMELYRKKVWDDPKSVNVIANACFSTHSTVLRAALTFFTGERSAAELDEDSSAIATAASQVEEEARRNLGHTKRKGKRIRAIKRAQDKIKKVESERDGSLYDGTHDFSAIRSVHDPQGFAERLLASLKKSNEAFDIRLLYMNVISRFVGCHELLLFPLYDFLQKYMQPHQKSVTGILVYLIQATHKMVPPEILQPSLKLLANNFVSDRSSVEVMALGLNTIREICRRQPLIMTADLLQDLVQYKTHHDKGIIVASRSLMQLFRQKNPELLMRKDRGHPMERGEKLEYGQETVHSDVAGADLLEQDLLEKKEEEGKEESNSEDEWHMQKTALSDSEEEEIFFPSDSDSEDEDEDADNSMDDDQEEQEDAPAIQQQGPSTIARSRILTPKDFERIHQLRLEAAMHQHKRRKGNTGAVVFMRSETTTDTDLDLVDATELQGATAMRNAQAEARQQARESKAAWQGTTHGGGTTNEDKRRSKPFLLTRHARGIRERRNRKQTDKTRCAAQHVKNLKQAGKRKRTKKAR